MNRNVIMAKVKVSVDLPDIEVRIYCFITIFDMIRFSCELNSHVVVSEISLNKIKIFLI